MKNPLVLLPERGRYFRRFATGKSLVHQAALRQVLCASCLPECCRTAAHVAEQGPNPRIPCRTWPLPSGIRKQREAWIRLSRSARLSSLRHLWTNLAMWRHWPPRLRLAGASGWWTIPTGVTQGIKWEYTDDDIWHNVWQLNTRESGGIGRRAGLRIQWGNPCRFKSCLSHSLIL